MGERREMKLNSAQERRGKRAVRVTFLLPGFSPSLFLPSAPFPQPRGLLTSWKVQRLNPWGRGKKQDAVTAHRCVPSLACSRCGVVEEVDLQWGSREERGKRRIGSGIARVFEIFVEKRRKWSFGFSASVLLSIVFGCVI